VSRVVVRVTLEVEPSLLYVELFVGLNLCFETHDGPHVVLGIANKLLLVSNTTESV
jgi:hypothetical protein